MVDRRENRCLGSCNGRAKLTEGDVRQLRKEYDDGVSQTELARKWNIAISTVCHIINRYSWKHV